MVNLRRMERQAIRNERVDLLFYKVVKKGEKGMLKPIDLKSNVPFVVIKALLDNTTTDGFYEKLAADLLQRGVQTGTTVQLRAKFSKSNATIDPAYKGTRILCEVNI